MDIRRLCNARGMSVSDLARIIGINKVNLYRTHSVVKAFRCSISHLMKVSKFFNMDPFDVYYDIYYEGPYRFVPFSEIVDKALTMCEVEDAKVLLHNYYTYEPEIRRNALYMFYDLYDEYQKRENQVNTEYTTFSSQNIYYGENVKNLRKLKKMSRKELAEKADLHKVTIDELELGRRCRASTLCKVAEVLNVSPYDLLFDYDSYDKLINLRNNLALYYEEDPNSARKVIDDLACYYNNDRIKRIDWLEKIKDILQGG